MLYCLYSQSDRIHYLFGPLTVPINTHCSMESCQTMQVQFWAPTAAGGGVSLVMAFLNGTDVPDLLRLQTLITKFIGSIFSCAANLTVGTEGPLVHMGACIASVIAFWECGMSSNTVLCYRYHCVCVVCVWCVCGVCVMLCLDREMLLDLVWHKQISFKSRSKRPQRP